MSNFLKSLHQIRLGSLPLYYDSMTSTNINEKTGERTRVYVVECRVGCEVAIKEPVSNFDLECATRNVHELIADEVYAEQKNLVSVLLKILYNLQTHCKDTRQWELTEEMKSKIFELQSSMNP
jgi:hypothetical protein